MSRNKPVTLPRPLVYLSLYIHVVATWFDVSPRRRFHECTRRSLVYAAIAGCGLIRVPKVYCLNQPQRLRKLIGFIQQAFESLK